MFDRLRTIVLQVLKVPPEPQPPFGSPSSIRVFRASRKLFWLRLIRWGFGQAAALVGILFWLSVILAAEHEAAQGGGDKAATGAPRRGKQPPAEVFSQMARKIPPNVYGLLWLAKGVGVVVYLGQLFFSYAAVRLDYELRWYMVTDRSLRIRSGLWSVRETTMSFANLQQVAVSQGPLERLLGIADLRVQSAGGGSSPHGEHGKQESMHVGLFHGVENAPEIRDLILDRLKQFRESGLGDPDERTRPVIAAATVVAIPDVPEVLAAASEILAEARALRCALVSPAIGNPSRLPSGPV